MGKRCHYGMFRIAFEAGPMSAESTTHMHRRV